MGGLEVAFFDAGLADIVVGTGGTLDVVLGIRPEGLFSGLGQPLTSAESLLVCVCVYICG